MFVNSVSTLLTRSDSQFRPLRNALLLAPSAPESCAQITGILSWLVDYSPTVRISVICNTPVAPIFSAVPNIDKILLLPDQTGLAGRLKLYGFGLRKLWDVVFDLRGEPLSRGWLTHARQSVRGNDQKNGEHPVEWFSRVAGFSAPVPPTIWYRPQHLAFAQDRLPPDCPIIGIGACAGPRKDRWPVVKYADLMKSLRQNPAFQDAVFVIYGGPAQKDLIVPLKRAVPRACQVSMIAEADILSSVACLSRTDLYIGDASDYLQLAAAAGVPTVALLSSWAPRSAEPWGERHTIIRGQLNPFDAAPSTPAAGMLSVEEVSKAVMAQWKKIRPEGDTHG